MMRWIVLLGLLVGCGHARPHTGFTTDELIPHIPELGRDGQTQISTVVETGSTRKPSDTLEITVDQRVRFRGRTTSLVVLLEGCPPFTGTAPCPIKRHDTELVYVLPNGEFRQGRDDPPPQAAASEGR